MYLGETTCNIILAGKYRVIGLNTVEVKKSIHQIVQTANLTLPLSLVMRNNDMLENIKLIDKIKEGDSITIDIGYNGNNKRVFEGYILRINPKRPLELELEDEMYLMRKLVLKKSFPKNDVRDVLNYLIEELHKKFNVQLKLIDNTPKVTVTNYLVNGTNGLDVLQELQEKYLITSYMTTINGERVLYAGLLYGLKTSRVKFILNKNTISIDDLKFTLGSDKTYKVTLSNQLPDGKMKKWEFGDKKGEEIKPEKLIYGHKTEAEMKHIADELISRYKISGYKGSFETFIYPETTPGSIAVVTDEQFTDRSGSYYIGTVTTSFGVSGGRRKVEIDFKTSENE